MKSPLNKISFYYEIYKFASRSIRTVFPKGHAGLLAFFTLFISLLINLLRKHIKRVSSNRRPKEEVMKYARAKARGKKGKISNSV